MEVVVALLIGTCSLELHGEFILDQNFAFDLPSCIRLFPFERAAYTMKRIESQQDRACFVVETTLLNC